MAKIKVGVMRGGPSTEHDVSLKTGENVLKYLPKEKYEGIDIFLDRDGQCYLNGSHSNLYAVNHLVDIVFNALHGYFGEDGKIQQLLDSFNIPYTGSGTVASAVGMSKILSRNVFEKNGIKIPQAIIIKNTEPIKDSAFRVFRSMNPFWVVKPASMGSSIGITIARNFDELVSAIEYALEYDDNVIVEEYIKGREVTCGIIDNFRDESHYAFPVVEIIPPQEHNFFDYLSKYSGETREVCPAYFDAPTKRNIEEVARRAHQVLGCEGYSRADLIVSEKGIYLLEVNTLPGLTSESLLPKSAEAVGLSFPDLISHIVDLAINKNRR